MPEVAQSVLEEFGKAVKRARSLKGWQLDRLSQAVEGSDPSRSYLSNVEKGKRQISTVTVGRLITALDLDEGWIDRFLDGEVSQEAEETPIDRETERLLRLKAGDDQTPDAAEDLLILLANTHAQGQYTDTFTAYQALRGALEAADRIRHRGEMPGNAGEQLQAVMAEVARLNAEGRTDEADGLLDAEEQRMKAAHRDEKNRQDAEATALLDRRLDQDRLRDNPQAAAKRLIRDLHRQEPQGGVWRATRALLKDWRERGEHQGDPFALRVALALAKANLEKAKGPMRPQAILDLGSCHLAIGERASDDRNLKAAETAFRAALRQVPKRKDPRNWAIGQNNLGAALQSLGGRAQDDTLMRDAVTAFEDALSVRTKEAAPMGWATTRNNLGVALQTLGIRAQDDALLRDAVVAFEDALTVWTKQAAPTDWAKTRNNLGNALKTLGELAQDDALLRDAVVAYEDALTVSTKEAAPMDWAKTKNNLGLALRWRGTVTRATGYFDDAEAAFLRCLEEHRQDTVPFLWATTQWNLGDLALARFVVDPDPALLDKAERHVMDARAVFAEGSDHQTDRCDELLQRIAEARRSA